LRLTKDELIFLRESILPFFNTFWDSFIVFVIYVQVWVAKNYRASYCSPYFDPTLSTLQSGPFVIAQHEESLYHFQSWLAEDIGAHLYARSLRIELGGLDGVVFCLLYKFWMKPRSLGEEC
jgi:hypothetical protein